MDSVMHTLPETYHGLEKKEGRNLTWLWRKSRCSGCFGDMSANRCKWWLIVITAWRKSVQTTRIHLKSKSAMDIPWRNRAWQWSSSWESKVQKASKGWLDDEGTKDVQGFLKFCAEFCYLIKMQNERVKFFLIVAAILFVSRVVKWAEK